MSDRTHHDPPLRVWVIPADDADLEPLAALLHSETEHEVILSEYNRREQCFELFERERRTKAYRHFDECRVAMLQERSVALEAAKAEARNQASIYNHILALTPKAFPDEQADQFLTPPAEVQGQEEAQASEEVSGPAEVAIQRGREQAQKNGERLIEEGSLSVTDKPATQRPSRRRR
jgi:hypothetical protein